jgi:hypothetical protein
VLIILQVWSIILNASAATGKNMFFIYIFWLLLLVPRNNRVYNIATHRMDQPQNRNATCHVLETAHKSVEEMAHSPCGNYPLHARPLLDQERDCRETTTMAMVVRIPLPPTY